MAFVCKKNRFGKVHVFISALCFPFQNEAVDVDIDEILDMDTDEVRRSHLFVSKTLVFFKNNSTAVDVCRIE